MLTIGLYVQQFSALDSGKSSIAKRDFLTAIDNVLQIFSIFDFVSVSDD